MFTIADQPERTAPGQDNAESQDRAAVAGTLRRMRGLLAAGAAAGCALAVAFALSGAPRFVATAQVQLDPGAAEALLESHAALAGSDGILRQVAERAQLADDAEFGSAAGDAAERQARVVARLGEALTVGREAGGIVALSLASEDANKATRLANLTADVFVESVGRGRSDAAQRRTDALAAHLADLQRDVTLAEQRVAAYRDQITPEHTGALSAADPVLLGGQLARLRGDVAELRLRAGSFERTSVDDILRGAVPSGPGSDALMRLGDTYSDLAQQAALLATKLGPRHPRRIASDEAVANAREAVSHELSRLGAAAGSELAAAEASERDLARRLGELRTKQAATGSETTKLRELQRDADGSRAVYEAFLLRTRDAGEPTGSTVAEPRVLSQAAVPQAPAAAQWQAALVVCLMGLLIGAGFVGAMRLARWIAARSHREEAADAPLLLIDWREPANDEILADAPALLTYEAEVEEMPAPSREIERQSLREQVRALANRTPADAPPLEGEGARLLRELEEVREAIAALQGDRSRRRAA